jgi:cell division protein FtsB
MATQSLKSQLDQAKAENAKLRADNKKLRQQAMKTKLASQRRPLRVIASICLISLAAALLMDWANNRQKRPLCRCNCAVNS